MSCTAGDVRINLDAKEAAVKLFGGCENRTAASERIDDEIAPSREFRDQILRFTLGLLPIVSFFLAIASL